MWPKGYYIRIMLNEQTLSPKFKINTTAIWQNDILIFTHYCNLFACNHDLYKCNKCTYIFWNTNELTFNHLNSNTKTDNCLTLSVYNWFSMFT